MSGHWCDEKQNQPLHPDDCTHHYPKFPHQCDLKPGHTGVHSCACGHCWHTDAIVLPPSSKP